MTVVAEYRVDASAFPLASLFAAVPGATLELERVVPSHDETIPYVWVRGVPAEDVRAAVTDRSGLPRARLVDSVGDEHLLRVEWVPEGLLEALVESAVVVLSAVGTADHWELEVRGDREAVAAFQATCTDQGIPITLQSHRALARVRPGSDARTGLTAPQREALALAYRRGYFDEPRRTTLEEMATDLGISRQALAARLKRGYRHMVETTVASR